MLILIGFGIWRPSHICDLWINAATDARGRPFLEDLAREFDAAV